MKIRAFLPATALPALDAALDRLNTRAAKLGAAPVQVRRTGRVERRERRDDDKGRFTFLGQTIARTLEFVEVEVEGEQPKLPGGWELLGVVDHREAVAITKVVPGRELPEGQRDRGAVCDHCNTKRHRADTFVLQAEDGRVVQVGRNCLADFLGAMIDEPERLLGFYVSIPDLLDRDWDGDEFWGDGGPRARTMIEVEQVVLISAAMVDQYGWVSKTRARDEDIAATADDVAFLLFPPRFTGSPNDPNYLAWKERKDALEARAKPSLVEEAKAATEWAKGQLDADNDYLRNLAACAISERVGVDKLGLVASLIASYRRAQERFQERERKAQATAASKHLGKPKQRLTLAVSLLERPRAFEGHYGTRYLHTFVTADGNVVKWWAQGQDLTVGDGGVEVGQPVTIKATVKKHEEWQGRAETLVQRVALVVE